MVTSKSRGAAPWTADPIVVGTSLAADSDFVVLTALEIGRSLRVPVEVVHALTPMRYQARTGRSGDLLSLDKLKARVHKEGQDQVQRLTAAIEDPPLASHHIHVGPSDEALRTVARAVGAGTIVVGPAEPGVLKRGALGTTLKGLLRECSRPILVVRGRGVVPPRTVLGAVDGSHASWAAVQLALEWCAAMAFETRKAPSPPTLSILQVDDTLGPTLVARRIEELEQQGRQLAGQPVRAAVVTGQPDQALSDVAWAEEADLIVAGAQDHGKKTVGRVTRRLASHSPCALFLLPPRALAVFDERRAAETL